MDMQTAFDIVYHAIDLINDLRQADDQIAKTPEVVLAGEGGCLDSLALVTLILGIERRVSEITGREIALLDESNFDPQFTRFSTPSVLASLLIEKLAE